MNTVINKSSKDKNVNDYFYKPFIDYSFLQETKAESFRKKKPKTTTTNKKENNKIKKKHVNNVKILNKDKTQMIELDSSDDESEALTEDKTTTTTNKKENNKIKKKHINNVKILNKDKTEMIDLDSSDDESEELTEEAQFEKIKSILKLNDNESTVFKKNISNTLTNFESLSIQYNNETNTQNLNKNISIKQNTNSELYWNTVFEKSETKIFNNIFNKILGLNGTNKTKIKELNAHYSVYFESLQRLVKPKAWLNDTVFTRILPLLKPYLPVKVLLLHDYSSTTSVGIPKKAENYDYILRVLNPGSNHWNFVLIDLKKKYYNRI